MKYYAISLLVFLAFTLFLGIRGQDIQKVFLSSQRVDRLVQGWVGRDAARIGEILRPRKHQPLTPIDVEGRFYFDKETVDSIIKGRFYSKESLVSPGVYPIVVTGYSSSVAQCDATPFITASGERVRAGVAAANFLPFGTKFKISSLFGDQVFEVQDRMAGRYWGRIDVWFPNYSGAKFFGARKLEVEVLNDQN